MPHRMLVENIDLNNTRFPLKLEDFLTRQTMVILVVVEFEFNTKLEFQTTHSKKQAVAFQFVS